MAKGEESGGVAGFRITCDKANSKLLSRENDVCDVEDNQLHGVALGIDGRDTAVR